MAVRGGDVVWGFISWSFGTLGLTRRSDFVLMGLPPSGRDP